MADCRKCKHNYKPSTCEPKCNMMCDGASDFEPITNFEVIQRMSTEELADWLCGIDLYWDDGESVINFGDVHIHDSYDSILNWLCSETE